MKKLRMIAAALVLSSVVGMSMTACGNSSDKEKSSSKSDTSVRSQVSDSKSKDSKESDSNSSSGTTVILESNTDTNPIEFDTDSNVKAVKPYKSLEEYLKSDKAKKNIEEIKHSDEENELPIDTNIKAEDKTKLVLERTINEQLEYPDAFLKTLASTLDSQKKTYVDLVKALEDCIEVDKINVVIRYFDVDGNKIFERVFDNKGVVESKEQSQESSEQSGEVSIDNDEEELDTDFDEDEDVEYDW